MKMTLLPLPKSFLFQLLLILLNNETRDEARLESRNWTEESLLSWHVNPCAPGG